MCFYTLAHLTIARVPHSRMRATAAKGGDYLRVELADLLVSHTDVPAEMKSTADGSLPLHLAAASNAPADATGVILSANPTAVMEPDKRGATFRTTIGIHTRARARTHVRTIHT